MRKRDFIILLLALAAAVTVSISVFAVSAIETGSWGLSFRQEGLPPIGNAGRDQLARLGAAYIGNTEEKVLYLTFDAGYENGCTAQILDVLKANDVPAAFFLVGNYIEKNPDEFFCTGEIGAIPDGTELTDYEVLSDYYNSGDKLIIENAKYFGFNVRTYAE